MKYILLVNGSPRGEKSNTLRLARAFCEGYKQEENCRIEELTIRNLDIRHCTGCFSCWTGTPGSCILKDDMQEQYEKIQTADLVIWSFPLYFFGMPSAVKAFMDRMLPLSEPFIKKDENGHYTHNSRRDLSFQKHFLISTCGLPTAENNAEALSLQFDIFSRNHDQGIKPLQIICPQGELFSVPPLKQRTNDYLDTVRRGGQEFARSGTMSDQTEARLAELLFPGENFIEMANNSWDRPSSNSTGQESNSPARRFIKQMAATYNPSAFTTEVIIEIAFTDLNETCQLHLKKDKCLLVESTEKSYTTRIETPFKVWQSIANGEMNGARAMMDGLYKVRGDFDVMNRMDHYFGTASSSPPAEQKEEKKKTNMNVLLLPWIVLWVMLPMETLSDWAGIAALLAGVMAGLAGFLFVLTPYDRISAALVSLFGLAALSGYNSPLLVCLTYFLFGLLWTVSGRLPIPLTAHYSKNSYNGDEALKNPLFIKTNRILTDLWGILYILVSLATWFLMHSPLGSYTGMINQIAPLAMGFFTHWFQSWYPAHVAGGKK